MTFEPFEELADSEGRLGRLFPERKWRIPDRVWIDGDRLMRTEKASNSPTVNHLRELLPTFINLVDAPAEKIVNFAKKWGVLNLCTHDVPAGHDPEYWPTKLIEAYPSPQLKAPGWTSEFPIMLGTWHCCLATGDYDKGLRWESVQAWRHWSRVGRATLNVAARLRSNKIGPEAEWRIACTTEGFPAGPGSWALPKDINEGWRVISGYLNYWLKLGSASLFTEVTGKRIGIVVGKGSLFGALAVQLSLAISGADGPVVCSNCKDFYVAQRRPRLEQDNYCPSCRSAGIPQKNASAAYRTRKRERHKPRGRRRH